MSFGKRCIGFFVLVAMIYWRSLAGLIWTAPSAAIRMLRDKPAFAASHDASFPDIFQQISGNSREVGVRVQRYFDSRRVPQDFENSFKEFMTEEAARSYSQLEFYLDCLLRFYWMAFPYMVGGVVCSLVRGTFSTGTNAKVDGVAGGVPNSSLTSSDAARAAMTARRTSSGNSRYLTAEDRSGSGSKVAERSQQGGGNSGSVCFGTSHGGGAVSGSPTAQGGFSTARRGHSSTTLSRSLLR